MDKMKYLFLMVNMLQIFILVDYDIVFYYLFFEMLLCCIYKSDKIMNANLYCAFVFSIGLYFFGILYIIGLITVFPTSIFACFVTVFTNFVFSLSFMDMESSKTFVEGDCPICFEVGNLEQLPKCKHTFHSSCLQKWFCKQKSCPLCRTYIKQ